MYSVYYCYLWHRKQGLFCGNSEMTKDRQTNTLQINYFYFYCSYVNTCFLLFIPLFQKLYICGIEIELENDRGTVETSFLFLIACFYNKMFNLKLITSYFTYFFIRYFFFFFSIPNLKKKKLSCLMFENLVVLLMRAHLCGVNIHLVQSRNLW